MPDTSEAAGPRTLDALTTSRWAQAALAVLRDHQAEIDALNVYPVPDGDTGTNLALTWSAACEALAAAGRGSAPLPVLARGALLGARGNSGVIVSQLLKGLADALPGPSATGADLALALRAAADAARAAVHAPVEGTVLTVAAAAAAGAARAASDDLVTTARAAAAAAAEALARTPEQLAVLKAAGVVDAGGRGLCLILDALVATLTGVPVPAAPAQPPAAAVVPHVAGAYGYEVQYLLEAKAPAVDALTERLAAIGDSLIVVGDEPTWNVHVHTDDIGAAVEAGVEAGRPYRISVTRLPEPARPPAADKAAVVMAAGEGLAALFAAEGAAVVGGNPSTAEVLDAIRGTGSSRVVLLPNDPNRHAVAGVAAREAAADGVRVSVVPTRSPVQALAALAVRDPARPFSDDVIAMAEAAGACRYGEVCRATREAFTVAGRCRPGDVLGLVDGEVHVIGGDLTDVSRDLLDRMLGGGGELVTLVVGADAPPGFGEALREHVERRWPFAEVHSYAGGQPMFPLLVGVE
ncbi:dihydroxyacetone kinase [Spirilliplanes yamanashiensis]|uniref:Dihydroxyacetone kinase n=1 Tax=Spirilliplanes yamanashiensis TaxID=42233 RepID=A0A8J3Y4P3_9ACTN|nr:DAK2 domain fusion protein YloV [Spirilliplanes yamanashiensis]GIJ01432.1 dihydroxyacetone kinase [Spirilliplanes yamanashiensis]